MTKKRVQRVLMLAMVAMTLAALVIPFTSAAAAPYNGWEQVNGKWYYYQNGVKLVGGFLVLGAKYYYLTSPTGAMQTAGWFKPYWNYGWYYAGTDGALLSGWQKIENKWYQFGGTNNEMSTGWWKSPQGVWYYLDPFSGEMLVGWLQVGGKTYFLDSSGAMVTGTVTISGVKHKFDTSGVWLGMA